MPASFAQDIPTGPALESEKPAGEPRRVAGAATPWAFRLAQVAAGLCIAMAISAGICAGLYRADGLRLEAVARIVTSGIDSPAGQVGRLTRFVFFNRGFTQNRHYFALPSARATPVQVLEHGGDCADKSRLLWALLRRLDIPATMAMCFDPQTLAPVHTVLEARVGPDEYMVSDPVYDLTFPRPDATGYFGLLDLRRDPQILQQRLSELEASRPASAPIHAYRRGSTVYDHASTINWNKNALTRAVSGGLKAIIGDAVYRIRRPVLLEEPQLAVGLFCVIGSLASAVAFSVASRRAVRAPTASAGETLPESWGRTAGLRLDHPLPDPST